jgi:hypothetical protein
MSKLASRDPTATTSRPERGSEASEDRGGSSGPPGYTAGPAAGPAATPGKHTRSEAVDDHRASAPVQRRDEPGANAGAANPASGAHAAAAQGIAGPSHALPHRDRIQQLFGGHDIDRIQAHTGAAAATGARAMGARAFATGDHVAFAAAPDLHTAAHEAAHVIQQRAGVSLAGGVGQSGDVHERNADAVADRVVQGLPAHDLLPDPAAAGATMPSGIQRQDGPREMTAAQVQAALDWAATSRISPETIREVQRVCGIAQTGVYDEATARGVFAKEQEIRTGADGKADHNFCELTGIIFVEVITAATVTDPILEDVATRFPDGVTVAIYPSYLGRVNDRAEFQRRADEFARNQHAVGLSGGAVAVGLACTITALGDVIEVVQSIHRGLVATWTQSQGTGGQGAPAAAPAYTKVRNLALFSHGESFGMGLNAGNDFTDDGLRNTTGTNPDTGELNPPNVEAFVRGLSDAVVPGVRVLLYGCSAGLGDGLDGTRRTNYIESRLQPQGDRAGVGSLGASLAAGFGPEASVYAHSTFGHTTENYSARVFGAEANGPGGANLFDLMYPETFLQSELMRLFPDMSAADRAARHDSLRAQMWAHFFDSIYTEHHRTQKRYEIPLGQEVFINPDNARTLLQANWVAWIQDHISDVRPA